MIAVRRDGNKPRKRPAAAVEYKEKADETTTAVIISVTCRFTICTKFHYHIRRDSFELDDHMYRESEKSY
jgi:hypothetical protein